MMMNHATMHATMVPVVTSTFCSIISWAIVGHALVDHIACVENIIHGNESWCR